VYDRWGNLIGTGVFYRTGPPPGYALPYNLNPWGNANHEARTGNYSFPDPLG